MVHIVQVSSHKIDITIVNHPMSNSLCIFAIISGDREPVYLEKASQMYQIGIYSFLFIIISITFGMRQYRFEAFELEFKNEIF